MSVQTIPERFRVGFGLAGALAIAGLITVTLSYGQGYFDPGYELTAVFPSSSQGLFTDGGSSVKLRGVNVGEVSGIELLPDGRARVSMFLDEGVRVPDTVKASIEPLSIFGPKFVHLEAGEHEGVGPFLGDGDEIERTATLAEVTDILESATELFEKLDPADLVVTIDAIAEGTSGMGDEMGRSIDAGAALLGVAADHADDIRRFLGDAALLTGTISTRGDSILATLANAETVISALGDGEDLDDLLDVTTGISSTFADLLRDNTDNLTTTIDSVGAFIASVNTKSEKLPDLLDLVGTFFGRLSDVIRFDGPADTKMAAVQTFISVDLCLVYGLCVGQGDVVATSAGAATPAQVLDARALRAMSDATPPTGVLTDFADLLTGTAP
jgi:phospholipid/cholesterol/gamma-HCH transport system substrate-binding protein